MSPIPLTFGDIPNNCSIKELKKKINHHKDRNEQKTKSLPGALGSCPYNYGSEAVQPGPGFALKISLIERGRRGGRGWQGSTETHL